MNCWLTHACSEIDFDISFFWTGTTHHLWFLPFVLVISIFSFLLAKIILKYPQIQLLLAATLFVSGAVMVLLPHAEWASHSGYTASLSYDALPAAFWGISGAIICTIFPLNPWYENFLSKTCFSLLAISALLLLIYGRNLLLENLGGVILLLFSITYKGRSSVFVRKVAAVGKYTYGIYLVHILFVEGFQDIAQVAGVRGGISLDLCVFSLSIILSLQTVLFLSRTNLQKCFGT